MENIRVFERKCIRTCLGKYRSQESNYKKYLKNKIIYDLANISRFDNFIIKQIRIYFARAASIMENSLIFPIASPNVEYIKNTFVTGFLPPKAFISLDSLNYIQDVNMVPIIYHIQRLKTCRLIAYPP